jgi:uncharacterized protein (UPF0332 family)
MAFDKENYKEKFNKLKEEGHLTRSSASFKIKLFLEKAEASFLIANYHKTPPEISEKIYWWQWSITIAYYAMLYAAKAAILTKGYEVKTHEAAQIALGHLLVPDKLEKEDLEILNQAHKIFEDEYVKYFEDARNESSTARYQARPSYTERRVNEILENSKKFVSKISMMIK